MVNATDPTLLSAGLRMFWGLLVVCGILLILYALMRKKLSFVQGHKASRIKIVEIRHLMPKKSVCLIEVSGQEFLLGISQEHIGLLAALPAGMGPEAPSFDATLNEAFEDSDEQKPYGPQTA